MTKSQKRSPDAVRLSRETHLEIIRSYLETLGTPRALSVWLLYKEQTTECHQQLIALQCDGSDFFYTWESSRFEGDYRATKFLSKATFLNLDVDREAVALGTAEWAESKNLKTNLEMRRYASGVNPTANALLQRVSQIVANILGPLPPSFEDVGWSKGRTTSAHGSRVNGIQKYRARLDTTVDALPHAVRLLNDSPLWAAAAINADAACSLLPEAFTIVEGNVLITVPKNAKTDRVICYEPHVNIRLQLSAGAYIRRRLRRFGVDLSDQSVNRQRARRGSKTSALATIDLKSASDTLSAGLVREVLPLDWWCYLDDLRSKKTKWPDGSVRVNQKFSSMGNGYTFELESLIFYAVCSACGSGCSVYGDDIVVPTVLFESAKSALELCGFSLNSSKSFSFGPFRESCGGDYFGGIDVTPVYLKELRTQEDAIKLHNQVRDKFSRAYEGTCLTRCVSDLLDTWRRMLPSVTGPSGFGDGHYHVNFDECCPARAKHLVDGWWFDSFLRSYHPGIGLVCGEVPSRDAFAAYSFGLEPNAVVDRDRVDGSYIDRKLYQVRRKRVLASFCWPGEMLVV